jgi:hypothetical protein
MNKLLIIILLTLSACSITSGEWEGCLKSCKSHGGLNSIEAGLSYIYCICNERLTIKVYQDRNGKYKVRDVEPTE